MRFNAGFAERYRPSLPSWRSGVRLPQPALRARSQSARHQRDMLTMAGSTPASLTTLWGYSDSESTPDLHSGSRGLTPRTSTISRRGVLRARVLLVGRSSIGRCAKRRTSRSILTPDTFSDARLPSGRRQRPHKSQAKAHVGSNPTRAIGGSPSGRASALHADICRFNSCPSYHLAPVV